MQQLDKGESYKRLKKSYIIFICPFDVCHQGRHQYTFENICKEDNKISLGDETTKIFLNADSRMDDVSKELRAFLDYVAGRKTDDIDDAFVEELERALQEAKKSREWRHEYMTLYMRDQENIEKGIEQGIEQGMKQGIEQGKIDSAIRMLEDGDLSLEKIALYSGLTYEQVLELKKRL